MPPVVDAKPREIVLATSNPAKRSQLRWLLDGLDLTVTEAPPRQVDEAASDFAGNASLKALAYSEQGLSIASDGGLEVPALAGRWDPLLTRRQGRDYLSQLTHDMADRRVRWIEAVAIADHGRITGCWTASGTKGVLAPEPWPERPGHFWVWEVFLFPRLGKVWADLSPDEREQVDLTWLELKRAVQGKLR